MFFREQKNQATKEDIKYLLEEIWCCESDEPFHQILSREGKEGTHIVLHESRAELLDLTYQEYDGALSTRITRSG